ncbi:uncharacterized protein LOC143654020 isoform X4 [Tamandua tetradactyla]|uniref:uncharacterized protein LOC143654020 isoform X4 n=1 Tax=Tamandua tetradactyla TaxID=48850 RepID=UPI004053FC5E
MKANSGTLQINWKVNIGGYSKEIQCFWQFPKTSVYYPYEEENSTCLARIFLEVKEPGIGRWCSGADSEKSGHMNLELHVVLRLLLQSEANILMMKSRNVYSADQ